MASPVNVKRFVGVIEKNWRERIEVREAEYNGKPYIDIRLYWKSPEDDQWRPSKKGVTLRPTLVKELIAILQKTTQEERKNADAQ